MEVERRLLSSLRRKPLSDCSNIVAATRRYPPSSAAKLSTAPKPSSSAFSATAINKSNTASITASSSLKLHTSIGSNAFLSDPPPPPTPFSFSDDRGHKKLGIPAAESQKQDAKAWKDRSKMVLKTSIAGASNTSTSWTLELSSSASDNCHQSRPSTLQNKNTDAQARNDKGKMILRNFNFKASEPVTLQVAHLIASSSSCGIHNQQRSNFLTVNNQRRSPQRRKHADGSTNLPLRCPPGKRTKRKGVKPDDSGVKKQFGSLADPLPPHEKRSRDKQDDAMHGMPQEEIERLRSYYADVDAFELPEEVAPEIDLD